MGYDKKSFTAGIAVGRQLKGWAVGGSGGGGPEPTGNIDIFLNGDYNVANYATAHVEVGSGASGIIYDTTCTDFGNWEITNQCTVISSGDGYGCVQKALTAAFVGAMQQTAIGHSCAIQSVVTDTAEKYDAYVAISDGMLCEFSNTAAASTHTVCSSNQSQIINYSSNDLTSAAANTRVTVWIREFSAAVLRWGWQINDEAPVSRNCYMRIRGLYTNQYFLGCPASWSAASDNIYFKIAAVSGSTGLQIPIYAYSPHYPGKAIQNKWFAIPCYAIPDDRRDYFVFSDGTAFYTLPNNSVTGTAFGSYRLVAFGGKKFIIFFGNSGTGSVAEKWGQLAVCIGDTNSGGLISIIVVGILVFFERRCQHAVR